jgi:hypothetical protein
MAVDVRWLLIEFVNVKVMSVISSSKIIRVIPMWLWSTYKRKSSGGMAFNTHTLNTHVHRSFTDAEP